MDSKPYCLQALHGLSRENFENVKQINDNVPEMTIDSVHRLIEYRAAPLISIGKTARAEKYHISHHLKTVLLTIPQ